MHCSSCWDPGIGISFSMKSLSGFLAEINTSESNLWTAGKNTDCQLFLLRLTPLNQLGVQQEKDTEIQLFWNGDNISNAIWIWNCIQIISGVFLCLCNPPGEQGTAKQPRVKVQGGTNLYISGFDWQKPQFNPNCSSCSPSSSGYWERPVEGVVMQKCPAGKGQKKAVFLGDFLAKGDGTFTRLCHAPQYLIFRKSLTSWKETQGSSMKSWKRKDRRKHLTLSRSTFFSARAIRMSRLSPLSWWGGFFECRWHNCWTPFSVCVPLYYHNLEKSGEDKAKHAGKPRHS